MTAKKPANNGLRRDYTQNGLWRDTRSAAAECDESSAFEMRSFLESMVAEQRAQRELVQEVLATCKRTAEEMKVLQSSYRLLKKESDGVREENQKLRAQLTGHSLNQ